MTENIVVSRLPEQKTRTRTRDTVVVSHKRAPKIVIKGHGAVRSKFLWNAFAAAVNQFYHDDFDRLMENENPDSLEELMDSMMGLYSLAQALYVFRAEVLARQQAS